MDQFSFTPTAPTPPLEGSDNEASSSKLLFVVMGFILAAMVVYSGYLGVTQYLTAHEAEALSSETTQIQQQVVTLQQGKVSALQHAKIVLDTIDAERVMWSKIIRDTLTLVPRDPKTSSALIEFVSYSGSSDGHLVLNGKTSGDPTAAYENIAQLVSIFNQSTLFRDAFVPTISKNVNEQGQTVLTFVLNLTYHGE